MTAGEGELWYFFSFKSHTLYLENIRPLYSFLHYKRASIAIPVQTKDTSTSTYTYIFICAYMYMYIGTYNKYVMILYVYGFSKNRSPRFYVN